MADDRRGLTFALGLVSGAILATTAATAGAWLNRQPDYYERAVVALVARNEVEQGTPTGAATNSPVAGTGEAWQQVTALGPAPTATNVPTYTPTARPTAPPRPTVTPTPIPVVTATPEPVQAAAQGVERTGALTREEWRQILTDTGWP